MSRLICSARTMLFMGPLGIFNAAKFFLVLICVGLTPGVSAATSEQVATGTPQSALNGLRNLSASICSKPAMGSIVRAFNGSGIKSASLSLHLTFTFDGTIRNVAIAKSSGSDDLDLAAMAWAWRLKLCPSPAGEGILPLSFSTSG